MGGLALEFRSSHCPAPSRHSLDLRTGEGAALTHAFETDIRNTRFVYFANIRMTPFSGFSIE